MYENLPVNGKLPIYILIVRWLSSLPQTTWVVCSYIFYLWEPELPYIRFDLVFVKAFFKLKQQIVLRLLTMLVHWIYSSILHFILQYTGNIIK